MPSHQAGQRGRVGDRRAQGHVVPEEDVASQGHIGSEAEGAQTSGCEPQQGQGTGCKMGYGQQLAGAGQVLPPRGGLPALRLQPLQWEMRMEVCGADEGWLR